MKKKLVSIVVSILFVAMVLSVAGTNTIEEKKAVEKSVMENNITINDLKDLVEESRVDITIDIEPFNPPIILSSNGGDFVFSINVENNEVNPMSFHVFTMVVLPNGYMYGPVKGPLDKIMRGLDLEISAFTVANFYRRFIDAFILDEADQNLEDRIISLGFRVHLMNTLMIGIKEKMQIANNVLKIAEELKK